MAGASAKIILLKKFEEKKFLKSIQDYQCNVQRLKFKSFVKNKIAEQFFFCSVYNFFRNHFTIRQFHEFSS